MKALKRPKGAHGTIYKLDENTYRIRVMRGVNIVKRMDGQVLRGEGLRRRYDKTHTCATDAEAWAIANEIWKNMELDNNLGNKTTLKEYFENIYIDEHLSRRAPNTQAGYRYTWKNYIEPAFGNAYPPDISHRQWQGFIDSIETPHLQRAAVRVFRAIVNNMRTDLRIYEPIGVLTDRIEYKPIVRKTRPTWTADEVREFLERIKGHKQERFFLLMLGGGLRRQEALPIVVPRDLSIEGEDGNRRIRFNIERVYNSHGGIREYPKTYETREVVIDEPFASRIAALMPETNEPIAPNTSSAARKEKQELKKGETLSERWFDGCELPSYTPDGMTQLWVKLFNPPKTFDNNGKEMTFPSGVLYGMRKIPLEALRNTNISLGLKGGSSAEGSAMAHGNSERIQYRHYLGTEEVAADHAAAVRKKLEQ